MVQASNSSDFNPAVFVPSNAASPQRGGMPNTPDPVMFSLLASDTDPSSVLFGGGRSFPSYYQPSGTGPSGNYPPPPKSDPRSANVILKELRKHRSLHGINNEERFQEFLNNPEYTAADMDLRFKDGRVVVAHDKPGKKDKPPDFEQWLDRFLALPPEKVATIKLDVKDKAAIDPMIAAIQKSQKENPEKWKGRNLIINADIPFEHINAKKKIKLEDMKKIRAALPNAIISLGYPANQGGIGKGDWKHVEKALKELGPGPKTIAFHSNAYLSDKDFEKLAELNTFVTLWNGDAHGDFDRDKLLAEIDVSKKNRENIWVEF